MLSFFRRALSSWVIIGLLGLLVVAFIVTGVGTPAGMGPLGGTSSADIARAGDRSLSVTDVSQRLQLELRQAKEQRPETTMALLLQGGALEQLVDQLTDLLSIRAFGEAHGMSVSDKLGDAEIASIPAFQGATGVFDDSRYRQALSSRGITPEEFRADIDQSIAIRHLLVPISASSGSPRDLVLPYASLLVERRSGTIVDFRNSAFAAGPAPTEAQLNVFYNANRARYTVPEQRLIRYAIIDKAMIAKSATATEAEIAAQYKKDAAKYAARENRDLTQIIVQDQKTAQSIAQKLASGLSMAEAAKAAQADAIPLKSAEKSSFAKQSAPSVADAAFGAAQGRIVGPIKSGLGWHIIRVDAVTNLGGKTLAQARAEIAASLSSQKAADAFANLLADVEDAVSDGQTFDDVVKSRSLTVISTPALTAGGLAVNQPGYRLDPSLAPMLKDAFQAELDDDPAIIPLGATKDAFYDLDRVIAAAPKPISAIRATVLADFVAERASIAARKAAETALAKARAGASLASLGGAARTVSLRRVDILKQGTAPTPDVQQLFDLGLGKASIVRTADKQGWMLVKLDRIDVGDLRSDPSLVPATQSQLSNAIGQEYSAQFASAVKAAIKTERNEDAIRDLRRSLTGSTGR
jgi:peptidyl-prolyl cis-trans isomerase D